MTHSVNKVTLVGNVGRNPTIRATQNGTKVAHLSLATNQRLPSNGGEVRERTDWHRLTFWNQLAEFAEQYVRRGDLLYVEGRVEYNSFERDGETIPFTDINVLEVALLCAQSEMRS